MSIRFVIRKNGSEDFPWAFRDAICAKAEHHDFRWWGWGRECGGSCNAFATHADAIEELRYAA
jgi:hypothetical protein